MTKTPNLHDQFRQPTPAAQRIFHPATKCRGTAAGDVINFLQPWRRSTINIAVAMRVVLERLMLATAHTKHRSDKLATLRAVQCDAEIRVFSDFTARRKCVCSSFIIHCLFGLLNNAFAVRRTLI